MADRVGQRLDNYLLLRRLGAGSFGEVYLAEQVYHKRHVAVKVLPQLSDNELPNFLNEARTIRLKHPHIVQVIDFGIGENRIPFIVMDYIPNGTLRQHYPKGTILPLETIVLYTKQVAAALKYAHDEKLIHRDVKPENILLRSKHDVVLSDFGIATIAHGSRSQSLQEMAGTITYMAPEQVQGKAVVASDQYALGVIVYEWLSGGRPFKGSPMELATQHMLVPPPPLREKVPGISPAVEQVVLTALQKDPNKRFADVQVFADALEQAARPVPPQPVPWVGQQGPSVRRTLPMATPPVVKSEEMPASTLPSSVLEHPNTQGSFLPQSIAANVPLPLPRKPAQFGLSIPSPSKEVTKEASHKHPWFVVVPLIILLLALASGGFFYFVHNNDSQAIDSSLNAAGQLITRAQGEVSPNPPQALKDLALAQNNLRDLQKTHTLDSNQTGRLNMLQSQMAIQVKAAIGSYNTGAKIAVVPCHGTTSHSINTTSTNIQPSSIAAVRAGNGSTVLFALGPDGVVYQVTNQYGLISVIAKTPSASAFAIAGNGTQLFLLAKQLQGTNGLPNSNGYSISMYALDQLGKPGQPISAVIDQTFTTGGYAPTLMASWNHTIYVVLTIPNQNKARILAFTPDNQGHLVPAKPYDFSNSQPIMSVAAFADQFFLLLSNGAVQSLSLAGAFGNQSQSTFPTAVQAKSPIEMPLATNGSNYTPAMAVPTVTPLPQSGSTSLLISTANILSVGVVNTVSHLYIGDSTNHRVLDLQEAAPPPTGTGTGKSITMQLVQQYVSSQELNVVKSLAVDPLGANLTILAQPGNTSPVHLVSVSTAAAQTGCSI